MSNELTTIQPAPAALTLPEEALNAVQEAFAFNVANGSVSEFDLPRIKIMNGGAQWVIPALEGEVYVPRIEGVIVFSRDPRSYYKTKNAGKVPPDCSSLDGVHGEGTPGGNCSNCSLAQWDSGDNGAQACKQYKQLFMLRGDSMFPELVSIPPTSTKALRQYLLRLATQGVPYYKALISLELTKVENPQGQPYGKASVKFLRRLSEDEAARALQFHQMVQTFARKLPANHAAADSGE